MFFSVAIKGYTAQSDGELTFTKGALVTELSDVSTHIHQVCHRTKRCNYRHLPKRHYSQN